MVSESMLDSVSADACQSSGTNCVGSINADSIPLPSISNNNLACISRTIALTSCALDPSSSLHFILSRLCNHIETSSFRLKSCDIKRCYHVSIWKYYLKQKLIEENQYCLHYNENYLSWKARQKNGACLVENWTLDFLEFKNYIHMDVLKDFSI